MTGDDNSLIHMAKNGDRTAFQALLARHYAMIHRVAYRFTGHAQEAEDVAQDVCIGLVHKLKGFRGESQFSTWLYRVVVNSCRDRQKSQSSHRKLEHGYIEMEEHHNAEKQEEGKKLTWLYRTIATLETPLKETALLVLAESLSHSEAGNVLGCAESTISWRMHEIRKQLKNALGSYHG